MLTTNSKPMPGIPRASVKVFFKTQKNKEKNGKKKGYYQASNSSNNCPLAT